MSSSNIHQIGSQAYATPTVGWGAVSLAALAAIATCLPLCSGCYDGPALVDQARSEATRNRLDEVELGAYRTTMPRDPETNASAEMRLDIFGTVPRYRIAAIREQLKTDEYRLRYEVVAAVRKSTPHELAEPDLKQLRRRLAEVVNRVLEDAPINTIGFNEIHISYQ